MEVVMAKGRVSHIRAVQTTGAKSFVHRIEAELKAARDLAAIKEARVSQSGLATRIAARPEILANQNAAVELIEYWATKSGFDTEKFDQILAQNQTELRRLAAERQAAAIRQSGPAMESFYRALEGKRRAFETLTAAEVEPVFVTL